VVVQNISIFFSILLISSSLIFSSQEKSSIKLLAKCTSKPFWHTIEQNKCGTTYKTYSSGKKVAIISDEKKAKLDPSSGKLIYL